MPRRGQAGEVITTNHHGSSQMQVDGVLLNYCISCSGRGCKSPSARLLLWCTPRKSSHTIRTDIRFPVAPGKILAALLQLHCGPVPPLQPGCAAMYAVNLAVFVGLLLQGEMAGTWILPLR